MDVSKALALARTAHEAQVDKAGQPYIDHVLAVMSLVETPEEKVVAALHDVVEDTAVTLGDIEAAGCPESILAAVDAISRRKNEGYEAFLGRVSANPLARRVKAADLCHNSDERRLSRLPKDEAAQLRVKYRHALRVLGAERQVALWLNNRRISEDSQITRRQDRNALSALFAEAECDVQVACAAVGRLRKRCQKSAVRLVLVHGYVFREGFFGPPSPLATQFNFSNLPIEALDALSEDIRAEGFGAIRAISRELVAFWCLRCQQSFCPDHWTTRVTYDDGFSMSGTCPSGHRQTFEDLGGSSY